MGFVWQNVSETSCPYLSALENVELPMIINGTYDPDWAKELLHAVGLGDRMYTGQTSSLVVNSRGLLLP